MALAPIPNAAPRTGDVPRAAAADKPADPKALDAKAPAADAQNVAPAKDVDVRLLPGQAANIALEQPEGKGGPEDAAKAAPEMEELKKLLGDLMDLLKKLTAHLEALLGGKGGPAPATAPAPDATKPPAPAAKAAGNTAPPAGSVPKAGGPGGKLQALEQQFGQWRGKGKNTSAPVGPKATKYMNEAYDKLSRGDIGGAQESYSKAQRTGSPVMLDLDGDGKLGTTGVSTAKDRVDGQVGRTVDFDLDGDGAKDKIEWSDGKGDGFLVDDSDGGASAAAAGNGEIDGRRLFGDEGGKFANGYEKLKKFDADGDGVLKGQELEGLKMWVDNGDARVGGGELKSLADLGITEISVGMRTERNARGEDLMRSTFVQDGQTKASEDVWFAKR